MSEDSRASVLNYAKQLTIDSNRPVIEMSWTVYADTRKHTLTIRLGDSDIVTIDNLVGYFGTRKMSLVLTESQRLTILDAMSDTWSVSVSYRLTTFDGAGQIGEVSVCPGIIVTREDTSKPIFTDATYADYNPYTVDVTGDDSIFVRGRSSLKVICSGATAVNGATIVGYRAEIVGKSVSSTSATIYFGSIPDAGQLRLTITAIDSRGYETSIDRVITVVEYENITIDSYRIRRENNVEDTIQFDFAGTLSPITVNGTAKNSFVSARYRTKNVSSTSWSSYATIGGVESGSSSFSFDNDSWITLSSANAYYVQFEVSDKLSTNTITLYIGKGQPLVAFRAEKVGINTNDPRFALDVNGDIRATGTVKMNDKNVQGFVGELEAETDLNDVLTSGIYYVPINGNIRNRPVTNSVAVLEVIEVTSIFVLQRFTCVDGAAYCRGKYNTTWHNWA